MASLTTDNEFSVAKSAEQNLAKLVEAARFEPNNSQLGAIVEYAELLKNLPEDDFRRFTNVMRQIMHDRLPPHTAILRIDLVTNNNQQATVKLIETLTTNDKNIANFAHSSMKLAQAVRSQDGVSISDPTNPGAFFKEGSAIRIQSANKQLFGEFDYMPIKKASAFEIYPTADGAALRETCFSESHGVSLLKEINLTRGGIYIVSGYSASKDENSLFGVSLPVFSPLIPTDRELISENGKHSYFSNGGLLLKIDENGNIGLFDRGMTFSLHVSHKESLAHIVNNSQVADFEYFTLAKMKLPSAPWVTPVAILPINEPVTQSFVYTGSRTHSPAKIIDF